MTESDLLTEIYYAKTKSQLSPHLTPALNLKDQEKRGGEKLTCRFKISSLAHVRLCSKFSCKGCLLHIPFKTTSVHNLGLRRFVLTSHFLFLGGIVIQFHIIKKNVTRDLKKQTKKNLNVLIQKAYHPSPGSEIYANCLSYHKQLTLSC